jgi:protoheme IX farnesyltransferase
VLAGAAAVNPEPQIVPAILALVLFLWTPPHFWSLAAAKQQDYADARVPMLPLVAPTQAWTKAILAHTAALAALSLLPLWFGLGAAYGVCAALGGGVFLWTSVELSREPTKEKAMRNFLASLVQLTLLIVGVMLDRAFGLAG